ncbi:MAG: penicillin-binding transpeptidase domain-containing protein [bacterium]
MKILLISLLLLFGPMPARAQARATPAPDPNLFYQEVAREVGRSTRRRDGVVLWIDRVSGERQVFGDPALLERKFLPGSTMKLVTAELALRSSRSWSYHCSGRDRIGGKLRHCWIRQGHGELDLAQALGQSCNLFFSWLGTQLGYRNLREAMAAEGFSGAAALPDTDPRVSAAADLAIGDLPEFSVSPAELANFWLRYLDRLSQPEFAPIRQGLRRAVREGTAKRVGKLDLEILGKTGTGDALSSEYPTNGWFLGAYPTERPRWALVVFLKEAHGFEEAAGLAGKVFGLAKKFSIIP